MCRNNLYNLDNPEPRACVGATDFLVNLGPLQPGLFQEEVYQGEGEILVEGDFQDVYFSSSDCILTVTIFLSPSMSCPVDW